MTPPPASSIALVEQASECAFSYRNWDRSCCHNLHIGAAARPLAPSSLPGRDASVGTTTDADRHAVTVASSSREPKGWSVSRTLGTLRWPAGGCGAREPARSGFPRRGVGAGTARAHPRQLTGSDDEASEAPPTGPWSAFDQPLRADLPEGASPTASLLFPYGDVRDHTLGSDGLGTPRSGDTRSSCTIPAGYRAIPVEEPDA